MIGKKFGRLTVISETRPVDKKHKKWVCLCECGTVKDVLASTLTRGHASSCGCLRRENSKAMRTTHGMAGSKLYLVYRSMISRCHDSKSKGFAHYGGRGISVCDRWRESFQVFMSDMVGYSDGVQIDRIDNSKGYSKENCRWASRSENCRNKRNNVLMNHNGETKTLSGWAECVGIPAGSLWWRVRVGKWDLGRALTNTRGGL